MAKERSLPTMADVAKEAGVALGTVSRVINGRQVGEEFRTKVEAAIDRLGYQYNSSGRSLRTGHTNTIAFLIPNTVNPFFSLLVQHVNLALEKRNCHMLLCFTEYDTNRENKLIKMALQNQVDGIIALTYNPNLVIPEKMPFVTIDRFFSTSVPCIASDNFSGGYLAAQKLKELGCRHVAFIQYASAIANEPQKRKNGFVSACIEQNLSYEVMALEDGQPYARFEHFLSSHYTNGRLAFDGLFVGTDSLAWQMIQTLKKMDIHVPEDVQVIGFDGIRMFGDLDPIVSSIVQPVAEIAETCVSTVLSRHLSTVPSLICLPVAYRPGGTTREERP